MNEAVSITDGLGSVDPEGAPEAQPSAESSHHIALLLMWRLCSQSRRHSGAPEAGTAGSEAHNAMVL